MKPVADVLTEVSISASALFYLIPISTDKATIAKCSTANVYEIHRHKRSLEEKRLKEAIEYFISIGGKYPDIEDIPRRRSAM